MSDEVVRLLALKAQCTEGESEDEHEAHRADLEAAYAAVGDPNVASTPAQPGEVTEIAADITVTSDASPQ